jgi:hypothetical protein
VLSSPLARPSCQKPDLYLEPESSQFL